MTPKSRTNKQLREAGLNPKKADESPQYRCSWRPTCYSCQRLGCCRLWRYLIHWTSQVNWWTGWRGRGFLHDQRQGKGSGKQFQVVRSKRCLQWLERKSILCVIEAPVPVGKTGRAFKLTEATIEHWLNNVMEVTNFKWASSKQFVYWGLLLTDQFSYN